MLNWFSKRLNEGAKNEQGFTLIELLVVVIIIGILAAIAIPVFLSQRGQAQEAAAQSDLRNAASAQSAWAAGHNGNFATTQANLETEGFRKSAGVNALTFDSSPSATEGGYCMTTSHSQGGGDFMISEKSGGVVSGDCT